MPEVEYGFVVAPVGLNSSREGAGTAPEAFADEWVPTVAVSTPSRARASLGLLATLPLLLAVPSTELPTGFAASSVSTRLAPKILSLASR